MKLLLTCLLMQFAFCVNAQNIGQGDDKKTIEYRETIGLDYSMPDYSTSKVDAKVIGTRLAAILHSLERNYKQAFYNRLLANIIASQMNNPNYSSVPVYKVKILKVIKKGDNIMISIKTSFKTTNSGNRNYDLTLRFIQGVSNDNTTNLLFSELCRYI